MEFELVVFDYNGTLCNVEQAFLSNEHSTLYEGVRETLQKLNDNGVLLSIATHMSAEPLKRDIQRLGIADFFIATRCIGQCAAKPNPQMIQELCDVAGGISSEKVLMVGDTEADIQMGINAGTATAAVSYGYTPAAQLKEMASTYCIDNFTQLIDIVLGKEA